MKKCPGNRKYVVNLKLFSLLDRMPIRVSEPRIYSISTVYIKYHEIDIYLKVVENHICHIPK